MKPLDRNISILEHIVGYCDQIEETIRRFGNDYGVFSADAICRNAAALCVLQIGDGTVDPEITWEILTEDIPKLKA